MATKEFNIDAFLAEANAARTESIKKKEAADKINAQKKLDSNAARKVQNEANLKFQFAKSLNISLLEFEGQLRALATKISRGDELTSIEEKELARVSKEYKKLNANYNKTMAEGNAILSKMPKSFEETKTNIQEDAGLLDSNKKEVSEEDNSSAISQEFSSKLANSGKYIAKLSDEERRSLAIELNKVYGFKLPTNGKYSANLKNAYNQALNDNLLRSIDYNRSIPFAEFLIISDNENTYRATEGAGTGQNKPRSQISNPTQAAATINAVIKGVFNRDATPKEIKDLTKKLNDAERKNPFKTVNGVTTGGLNDQQFLLDILKVTPEFAKRKTEGSNIDAQIIRGTARSNFLELSDVQVNNFLKDVQGGQDINTIRNRIRSIAAMGMPDSIKKMVADGTDLETIYQPYKNRMASILELNEETIDINDATLRSAIGADREMPLYEFEKALRKDSRWQYTTNARDKVSEISARIRRDFGFEA